VKRLALAVVLGFAAWPASASALDFPVGCTGTTGDTATLIASIEQANITATPDRVVLGPGCTYTLEAMHNGWFGANALPPITSDITIEGNGATLLRGEFGQRMRFFFIGAPPTSSFVTPGAGSLRLRNVTLTGGLIRGGGSSSSGAGAGMGGAIFNMGTLTAEGTTFAGNTATGGASGATSPDNGGGGMLTDSIGMITTRAGGMTDVDTFGPGGGLGGAGGGGGGGGLRDNETGGDGTTGGGKGGGNRSGTGGFGGGLNPGMGGDGSGGGGFVGGPGSGAAGGKFGQGGLVGNGGGGGGAGGGGGRGTTGSGGGGGFGAGGGMGAVDGGGGGFGGGAGRGVGTMATPGVHGARGFGGGSASSLRGGGGAGFGGAIFNFYGSVSVSNSTFTGNSAIGGGLLDSPEMGAGMGGSVFNMNGPFQAANSTFAANHSSAAGTSIYNLAYDDIANRVAQVTLTNTIVGIGTAGSSDLISDEADHNLILTNQGTADAAVGDRNIVQRSSGQDGGTITGTPLTSDPLLQALADNGGPTQTMAPADGSPALDAGREAGLVTDQRGLPRPSDLPGVANFAGGTDIGAVEIQGPAPPGGGNPGGGNGGGTSQAFGADTLVTIRAARTIGRRGVVPVVVSNRNAFAVTGRLSGRSARRLKVGASQRRFVRIRGKALTLRARGTKVVNLRLPRALRRMLLARRRVALRLTASVRDPAGNKRAVSRRATPRLRR
jgi:hypothetical protein